MRSQQFQALVAQFPDNELHRFSLAQALLNEGRPEQALPHLEWCRARRADWMVPRILLGKALLNAGRPADARPVLEEALRLAIEQRHETPEAELRALLADLP
jgi:predicted Zn-dependent protease